MATERDYPTDSELKLIAEWPYNDAAGWFAFIRKIWWMSDWGWGPQKGRKLYISTGGWSGNEEIIGAMRQNFALWSQLWESVRRGGHYVFIVPKEGKKSEAVSRLPKKPV